ncbi:Protein kinase superfamily protein [Zea mays]|uniref:Protein kinase superfamily protein n=1 Tax=Zea mays TaxID=4577 RepID=A0A1D6P3F5_MAIZE|nr:Protein kinase superfamily protein [Zea mays]
MGRKPVEKMSQTQCQSIVTWVRCTQSYTKHSISLIKSNSSTWNFSSNGQLSTLIFTQCLLHLSFILSYTRKTSTSRSVLTFKESNAVSLCADI